jgi:hypothetical protein
VVFTVPLVCARPSPSNGCKQTPYCLQRARHTLLLRGRLVTDINKHHIAYSMHVTIYDMTSCSLVGLYQRSGVTQCLLLQGNTNFHHYTKQHDSSDNASEFYSGGSPFESRPDTDCPEGSRGYSQFLQCLKLGDGHFIPHPFKFHSFGST